MTEGKRENSETEHAFTDFQPWWCQTISNNWFTFILQESQIPLAFARKAEGLWKLKKNRNLESLRWDKSIIPVLSSMSKVPASRKTNRSTPAAFPFDKTFLTSSLMRRYSFEPGLQSPPCIHYSRHEWICNMYGPKLNFNYIHTYCMALAGRQPMRGRRHGNVAMRISPLLLLLLEIETAKSTKNGYRVVKV